MSITNANVQCCAAPLQQRYLKAVHDRNTAEKSQFKDVVHHYIAVLKQLRTAQDQCKILERENYAIKQTKGDALQIVKYQEQVKQLESQLKDMYKGQIGNSQEVLKQVLENKELGDKTRELEKKVNLQAERLREYEDILKKQVEESDSREAILKVIQSECEALKGANRHLENKVRELTHDNQNLVSKILELKDEQAKAFNEANKIYMEAQRIRNESTKKTLIEEEKSSIVFGQPNVDLDEFIKAEYLMASPFMEVQVPSKTEFKIAAHKREATCLAFNPIGDILCTGGGDSLLKLWNVKTGKEEQCLRGFTKPITDCSISMDNEYLAAASTEHKACVYKLKTMRVIQTFQGHKDTINACKFSFAKKSLITGSLDRTIKLWDVEKGICTKTNVCMSQCFDVHVSLSEQAVASAHFDGTIRLWSMRTGELQSEIKQAHDDIISCVRFTPDEKYLVSTGKDHSIRVFDSRMVGKEVSKFYHENYKCSTNTNRLCISPNSKFVIVGSQNGNVIIYDLTTNDVEEIYEGVHTTSVVSCDWQPRGSKFATIDNLGSLFIWNS